MFECSNLSSVLPYKKIIFSKFFLQANFFYFRYFGENRYIAFNHQHTRWNKAFYSTRNTFGNFLTTISCDFFQKATRLAIFQIIALPDICQQTLSIVERIL